LAACARSPRRVACDPRRSWGKSPPSPGSVALARGRPLFSLTTPSYAPPPLNGASWPRMGSSSTPVPVRYVGRRRIRPRGALSGLSDPLLPTPAVSSAATLAGSNRSRGRAPLPNRTAPSRSALLRTHAAVTPNRAAIARASTRPLDSPASGARSVRPCASISASSTRSSGCSVRRTAASASRCGRRQRPTALIGPSWAREQRAGVEPTPSWQSQVHRRQIRLIGRQVPLGTRPQHRAAGRGLVAGQHTLPAGERSAAVVEDEPGSAARACRCGDRGVALPPEVRRPCRTRDRRTSRPRTRCCARRPLRAVRAAPRPRPALPESRPTTRPPRRRRRSSMRRTWTPHRPVPVSRGTQRRSAPCCRPPRRLRLSQFASRASPRHRSVFGSRGCTRHRDDHCPAVGRTEPGTRDAAPARGERRRRKRSRTTAAHSTEAIRRWRRATLLVLVGDAPHAPCAVPPATRLLCGYRELSACADSPPLMRRSMSPKRPPNRDVQCRICTL